MQGYGKWEICAVRHKPFELSWRSKCQVFWKKVKVEGLFSIKWVELWSISLCNSSTAEPWNVLNAFWVQIHHIFNLFLAETNQIAKIMDKYWQRGFVVTFTQANSQDLSVKNKRVLTVKTKVKDYKFCDSMIKKGL